MGLLGLWGGEEVNLLDSSSIYLAFDASDLLGSRVGVLMQEGLACPFPFFLSDGGVIFLGAKEF